jgi:energy-coupling factor transporter ATP-binding protein EcfA2
MKMNILVLMKRGFMDFYRIKSKPSKDGIDIYPDFIVARSKDLMVRGQSFYAIWNEEVGLWSTDEYDVIRFVDSDLRKYASKFNDNEIANVRYLANFNSGSWEKFKKFVRLMSDSAKEIDSKLAWQNTSVKKEDYISKRLPYALEEGSIEAYDELIGTLYDEPDRRKLEWAIGSIVSGDSRNIQKFIVLYGAAGAGKSTFLNILQMLFKGYYTVFDAKALGSSNNAFATEVFKSNPLVAIQHDGDLSKIEDNTRLNSIISHEEMTMNEKYKSSYMAKANCFLFMATNQPVKITDAKSGIIRRLIDVRPSGNRIPPKRYSVLMGQIEFELGAIAFHCLEVYRKMGKNYYQAYRPIDMMYKTDVFFNFVEDSYPIFKEQDCTTLKSAYSIYKEYCEESGVPYKLPMYKFREELKNYFKNFDDYIRIDGKQVRSYYSGFDFTKFNRQFEQENPGSTPYSLVLDCETSIFDEIAKDYPAQYGTSEGVPRKKWENVETKLSNINTKRIHYVQVPENHIVIDFDIKDKDGKKSLEKNIEAAAKWPPTYAEYSKSGRGIHLHYIYDGDVKQLSRIYAVDIEIKVFTGNASLRRKLTKCNNLPIAKINSGLPMKEEKRMISFEAVKSEKALRSLIEKNLRKEIHANTTPSVNFIFKILEDAYNGGLVYDVTDLRPAVFAFCNDSTHQAEKCLGIFSKMHFSSENIEERKAELQPDYEDSAKIVFYDVEVFPNLFIVVWKVEGGNPIKMINPTPIDIEQLVKFKLIGFNNRRYDNHILYARILGYTNEQLYNLSQKIISGSRNAMFAEAYNLSYADIYDFSSKKQSLKKFEIELGIHHQELGLKWNEPVPEKLWNTVADYCVNDVLATEATFKARKQDFVARELLAKLSGLTVNDTTQQHTARIIFGKDSHPQDKFVYTDLSEMFPGYSYEFGHSYYMGEETGEGGYVYSEPGMYGNVALLDIASMHPHSIIALNLFGPYTKNFQELMEARLAIKHKDYKTARKMLGGALAPYLENEDDSDALAHALKIVINIVYGLTSAKFDNKFRDKRNVDNIVAKRGALFMINLKYEVKQRGYTVAHIKTDSIKIPDADDNIIQFIMEYGKKYGYTFEHEATYEKMCLVNDAVYVAKYKGGKHDGEWTATGTQFQHPYVFKTLFSKEPIVFEDYCETKSVTSALYLDMNENLDKDQHDYHFVGKVGQFCPILPGKGGGLLLRQSGENKYSYANGAKGYRWLESEVVRASGRENDIDTNYAKGLVDASVTEISKYGDFEWFASDEPYIQLPWE